MSHLRISLFDCFLIQVNQFSKINYDYIQIIVVDTICVKYTYLGCTEQIRMCHKLNFQIYVGDILYGQTFSFTCLGIIH
jgi:hypothetical protein